MNRLLPNTYHPTPNTPFYKLGLYSLYTSIEAVLGYLDKIEPGAACRPSSRSNRAHTGRRLQNRPRHIHQDFNMMIHSRGIACRT